MMAENYKHLYKLMKKVVESYQDVIVPGLRKVIDDIDSNMKDIGNCDSCHWAEIGRQQKCSCCRRNRYLKDCYERRTDDGTP